MHFIHINKEEIQTSKIIYHDYNTRSSRIKQTCTICGKVTYKPLTVPMTPWLLKSSDDSWTTKSSKPDICYNVVPPFV